MPIADFPLASFATVIGGFKFEVRHRDALRKFESGSDSIQVTSPLGTVPGALATALK